MEGLLVIVASYDIERRRNEITKVIHPARIELATFSVLG